MPYTTGWNSAEPPVGTDADQIGIEIRKFKLQVEERINTILGLVDADNGMTKDPILDGSDVKSLRALLLAITNPPSITTLSLISPLIRLTPSTEASIGAGTTTFDFLANSLQRGAVGTLGAYTIAFTNLPDGPSHLIIRSFELGGPATWPTLYWTSGVAPSGTGTLWIRLMKIDSLANPIADWSLHS